MMNSRACTGEPSALCLCRRADGSVTHSSLLDMEIKYNRTIEEKTLLEQEVIAKQELEEECQRLKDDVRGGSCCGRTLG